MAREIDREIQVLSGEREVVIGSVSSGETWSFSASGLWTNGFIHCGPDGYRNFLADALQFTPRAGGEPWFRLMGEIKGDPRTAFPIGAGCTRTFDRAGTLVAFANDSLSGYANNKGAVTLKLSRGGVAPGTGAEFGGFIGWWRRVRSMASRTKGIPLIAALIIGASAILVLMQQGQDLMRGIAEDDFLQPGSRLLQIAFAVGLLFLAIQAWSWSRIIIDSNYGTDRALWRPEQLLTWTPRILGALPFAASAWALWKNPARNSWFVLALVAIGVIFFAAIILRTDVVRRLRRRAAAIAAAAIVAATIAATATAFPVPPLAIAGIINAAVKTESAVAIAINDKKITGVTNPAVECEAVAMNAPALAAAVKTAARAASRPGGSGEQDHQQCEKRAFHLGLLRPPRNETADLSPPACSERE